MYVCLFSLTHQFNPKSSANVSIAARRVSQGGQYWCVGCLSPPSVQGLTTVGKFVDTHNNGLDKVRSAPSLLGVARRPELQPLAWPPPTLARFARSYSPQVVPRHVLERACGFAIFTVAKAGFLFSARAGSGLVIARTADGCEWGRRERNWSEADRSLEPPQWDSCRRRRVRRAGRRRVSTGRRPDLRPPQLRILCRTRRGSLRTPLATTPD